MDNSTIKEKSSADDFNRPIVEFESLAEQSQRSIVPKIRIRLRPQVQSSNVNSDELICTGARTNTKDICDKVLLVQTSSDNSNWNSNKRCYKTLEDSGGGGANESQEYKNHFMIHGINLRKRPQKVTSQCKKNTTTTDKKRLALLTQSKNKEFIKQSQLKPIAKKGVFQSIILKSNKTVDEINKDICNNKLSRKQVNKIRNETLISNINLKDIINQENFIKLPSEIQWQLVNLLPNCDKPKLSSELDSCKCTDFIYNSNDNFQTYPNLGFSVLNNEFLGKALAKFSLKMGQCDLINILNSERENLRSRPLTILNDESVVKSNVENEIEVNECQNNNVSNEDNNKMSDEVKSNSSTTTTDTVEMNGIGNIDEKSCIEFQNKIKKYENNKLIKCEQEINESIHEDNRQILEKLLELPIVTEISIKDEDMFNNDAQDSEKQILTNIEEKNSSPNLFHSVSIGSNDTRSINSEVTNEKRRKRGRKRKLFNASIDLQITPIKRSNRSTAGKRPARLDSESPPTSPNVLPVTEKKLNIKCKKYKDQMHFSRKHKLKYDNFLEQFDSSIKLEVKSSKSPEALLDSSKSLKICPPSPDSLFSGQTESDLSPLSKPSPNGNSLLSNFIRSNVVVNHINSVQTLSPSWSCTSESTTPSAKSDYGHIQPVKPSVNVSISVSEIQNSKSLVDAEVKQLQRMPPPRQTLTLAAMREKMRAKKLAKEDNRKVSNSNNRKSSSLSNNQKHKKQNLNILLKEGDDDFKLMEKIISNSDDIDDLLNNSQESLLEFFMGNNYDFDSIGEQCVNLNSFSYKSNFPKKSHLKPPINVMEKINKISATSPSNSETICDENGAHSNKVIINECKLQYDKVKNSISENTAANNQNNKELPAVEKSFTDAISYVLQKLNLSKETNGVVPHNNTPGKSSHPNAYLVDSNGLTTALSIIQSMNPGAKVTTQQFYLVNSGPQLVLQPNPPLTEKITNSSPLGFPTKISLAPKITNPVSSISQTPNVLRDHLPSHNNSFSGVSMGQISYNSIISERSLIQMPETSSLKMSVTDAKNTFMVSSITPNMPCNQSRSLHLQTISTPQPIGFVQPVQQSLPSLFPSQLRFMQPTLSNSATPNAISFLTSNNATCNASIVNTNQPPKLLFLCPTVPNNSNLVTASNVLNPDQKYLLLSKQPDKQTTIQLVSSQGLWQQLNPNLISQPNNVLVMQSQPINTVYESLICPNTYLPAISPINTDYSINDRKNHLPPPPTNEMSQISMSSVFKEQQNKQMISSNESNSSSLIIDSRSLNTNPKTEPYFEKTIKTGKPPTAIESPMTVVTLSNHVSQSVNNNNNNSAFSFFPTIQSLTSIASEINCCTSDENNSTLLTEKIKNSSVHKSDQADVLQSSQDINSS